MGINPATTGIKDFVFSIAFSHSPSKTALAGSAPITCHLFYTESLLGLQRAVCTDEELAVHQESQREQDKPEIRFCPWHHMAIKGPPESNWERRRIWGQLKCCVGFMSWLLGRE